MSVLAKMGFGVWVAGSSTCYPPSSWVSSMLGSGSMSRLGAGGVGMFASVLEKAPDLGMKSAWATIPSALSRIDMDQEAFLRTSRCSLLVVSGDNLRYRQSFLEVLSRAARRTRTYGLRLPYVGYGYGTVSPLQNVRYG